MYKRQVLLDESSAANPLLDKVAGDGGRWGRGGMVTKVHAARIAARSGTDTFICAGDRTDILTDALDANARGTWLRADRPPIESRKQWLATLPARGQLILDQGAARVLEDEGRSLLPVGVRAVEGNFAQGELVACFSPEGREIARGLTNYSSKELDRIKGCRTQDIEGVLGYLVSDEVIHRDDLLPL